MVSKHQVHWIVTAIVCVIFTTSCGDPFGPQVSGTFILHEVDGHVLPIELDRTGANLTELFADTLDLLSNQRFRRTRVIRTTDLPSGVVADRTQTWAGAVQNNGQSWILLQDVCRPDSLALCIAPDTMRIVDRGIEVRTLVRPSGRLLFVAAH